MSDPADNTNLRAEMDALHDQVRQLVRLDRQLFRYQHTLDGQLQRIQRINRFALEAAQTTDTAVILDLALAAVLDTSPLEFGVGLLRQASALHLTTVRVLPGLEPSSSRGDRSSVSIDVAPTTPLIGRAAAELSHLGPLLDVFDATFPETRCDDALFLYLPIPVGAPKPLAALLFCKPDPSMISAHEPLPTAEDLPFFELLAGHVGAALRAATFANELEQRVADRTARLKQAQDQLVHAEKMAAVGTLVAGLSHELNNPITVILGFAQGLLRNAPENTPLRGGLEAIERQARRCARLVSALLDFSQHEPLVEEPCALGELLERVATIARPRGLQRQVTLHVAPYDPDMPEALVCITQLESALLSIVHNAIDASPTEGIVTLRLSTTAHQPAGFVFEIEDHGEGISPERMRRVFDPFYTTRPIGQGTGLGLSLARKIVDSHEGSIQVLSEPGRGTRVLVWLPLRTRVPHAHRPE